LTLGLFGFVLDKKSYLLKGEAYWVWGIRHGEAEGSDEQKSGVYARRVRALRTERIEGFGCSLFRIGLSARGERIGCVRICNLVALTKRDGMGC
jgi:hypothetical protein